MSPLQSLNVAPTAVPFMLNVETRLESTELLVSWKVWIYITRRGLVLWY